MEKRKVGKGKKGINILSRRIRGAVRPSIAFCRPPNLSLSKQAKLAKLARQGSIYMYDVYWLVAPKGVCSGNSTRSFPFYSFLWRGQILVQLASSAVT